MFKAGPAWRTTGTAFDHQGKSEIAQIFIFHSAWCIFDIQFLYVENGGNKLVLSEKIGSSSTNIMSHSLNTVTLGYPSEFITGISGKYRHDLPGRTELSSITFHTNKGQHGPFEPKLGSRVWHKANEIEFSYDAGCSKFGGFFGTRLDNYIESIGIYVKPIEKLPINPVKKESI